MHAELLSLAAEFRQAEAECRAMYPLVANTYEYCAARVEELAASHPRTGERAVTDLKLPELPVSPHVISGCTGPEPGDWRTWTAYTEAHMHAYATAAVLAERERRDAEADRYANALNRIDHWLNRYDVGIDDAQDTLDRIRDEYEAARNPAGDDDAR